MTPERELSISISLVTYFPDYDLLGKLYLSLITSVECLNNHLPTHVILHVVDNSAQNDEFKQLKKFS